MLQTVCNFFFPFNSLQKRGVLWSLGYFFTHYKFDCFNQILLVNLNCTFFLCLFFVFQLPVVIRVPRLQYSALTLCEIPMSLLGFGDIIVPGE